MPAEKSRITPSGNSFDSTCTGSGKCERANFASLWIRLRDGRRHMHTRLHSCRRSCGCACSGLATPGRSFKQLSRKISGHESRDGHGYSVLEIIQAVENATGRQVRRSMERRRPGDPPILVADPSKAHSVLGWTAKRNLADIVGSAWAWMQISKSLPEIVA